MKLIKRLFILVLIIGAFFAGVTYYQGRQQYTDAVAQVPVEEKIQQIRSMENYTAYSQLPQTYVDAVIAEMCIRDRPPAVPCSTIPQTLTITGQ